MKTFVTVDFKLDYHTEEVSLYFEVGDEQIFLCKVVESDYSRYTTVRKCRISCNAKYANWLVRNSGTYKINEYEEDTELNRMYRSNYWFICPDANENEKYIRELGLYIKELEGE
jgi:hypothetical protein